MPSKTTILGSGAMATACAILLADHEGQDVAIWARNEETASELRRTRRNERLLPGIVIPHHVQITHDIAAAVEDAEFLVAAIPSQYLRSTLESLSKYLTGNRPVISVVKGMENETFLRPSQIIEETLGSRAVVALSGPSHAEEIARRLPASVVAASGDVALARRVQEMISTDRFRVYTNQDLIGVELAGALKNVIGIAAGISDGLGYGDNAKSALMTRGIVEITRFGMALGAEPDTFAGLAGIGDLITTCVSPYGRNRMVGERLGKGESLAQILKTMDAVAEGVSTTRAVYQLAEKKGIDMPITEQVYRVLFEGLPPAEATDRLMNRPVRGE
ncbi:NAD(P)H-dependent glycerol-3-phosphate dehydrogenase [Planctomicrobium piriforme]|uniref:Glycerol-3-phosphate dehydrogenase [NAD(P)+] n=1 Tax=Planctomicrobium piriforme TaxID=1576369 RepID=A0A1I3FUF7_9PLAN|nr:NAD(P)H-dependent glycerol-3-phosphate dehydrogenase [Planctomicrobium piriforme]SFI14873.1 glycerol-3-phosphate dehydrogenase (NAD(P)+) [Planctomicrobium piriforme]